MSPERLCLCEECLGCLSASCHQAAWGSRGQTSWSFLQLSSYTEFSTYLKTHRLPLAFCWKVNLPVIYFQFGRFWTDGFINQMNFIISQGQLRHQGQVDPFGTLPLVHLSAYIKKCPCILSICTHIPVICLYLSYTYTNTLEGYTLSIRSAFLDIFLFLWKSGETKGSWRRKESVAPTSTVPDTAGPRQLRRTRTGTEPPRCIAQCSCLWTTLGRVDVGAQGWSLWVRRTPNGMCRLGEWRDESDWLAVRRTRREKASQVASFHFIEQEIEALSDKVTCPKLLSCHCLSWNLNRRPIDS